MESQPQNPEFRINPENFHPCKNPNHMVCIIIILLFHRTWYNNFSLWLPATKMSVSGSLASDWTLMSTTKAGNQNYRAHWLTRE